MIKFQMLILWVRSQLDLKFDQNLIVLQLPAGEFLFLFVILWMWRQSNFRESCIKIKMANESGKTTQALPLKGLTGKQRRQAEKLSLILRGEGRVTARCSSRRVGREKEKHFSRGVWVFRNSPLWIVPLRCLSKLAIAERRCSRCFFFDEYMYECAGFVECPHALGGGVNRNGQVLERLTSVVHAQVWERSNHVTCEQSVLLTVDWLSTVGDWALRGLPLIWIAMEDFWKKERKRRVRNYRTEKWPRDQPGFEPGPFAFRANALPTEPQVTVRGECSLNPTQSIHTFTVDTISHLKERKRRVRNYRGERVTKRPAGFRTGTFRLLNLPWTMTCGSVGRAFAR